MISTLIALVLSLIIQAQSPKVPIPQKIAALELAEQILTVASQEQQQASTTPATVQITVAPSAPVQDSTSSDVAPAQTNDQADTQVAADTQPAPTCSLEANVVTWPQGTQHAQFAWQFTPDATATINTELQFGPNDPVPSGYQFAASSTPFGTQIYSSSIFQDTDYTMTVSLGGQTGTCTATAQI